jgi:ABC-2 type transport system ATP-binding protein
MSLDAVPLKASPPVGSDRPENAVVVKGLTKIYRGRGKRPAKTALDHVDLAIPAGCLFGLLGPNGAGKSTLINILAGLVLKSQGEVRVWDIDIDRDPRRARSAIGVVPQELTLDAFFSPREQLELQAGLYGVPKAERRTDEILEAVGLSQQRDAYARTLSGGMRRRLLVAKALVHSPPILVLDEPTAGVDVELRQQLWDYVRRLNRQGVTVLLTTHYLEEAEELCDRIAIIDQGKLIACEPTESLAKRLDSKTITLVVAEDLETVPPHLGRLGAAFSGPRRLVVHYKPSEAAVGSILEAARQDGLSIVDVSTEESDLEDVFLQLTRKPA